MQIQNIGKHSYIVRFCPTRSSLAALHHGQEDAWRWEASVHMWSLSQTLDEAGGFLELFLQADKHSTTDYNTQQTSLHRALVTCLVCESQNGSQCHKTTTIYSLTALLLCLGQLSLISSTGKWVPAFQLSNTQLASCLVNSWSLPAHPHNM